VTGFIPMLLFVPIKLSQKFLLGRLRTIDQVTSTASAFKLRSLENKDPPRKKKLSTKAETFKVPLSKKFV
jgi:hypothetical protein